MDGQRTHRVFRSELLSYLDVIHIAIVCGVRDLLELRFGSISPLDLNDLIASGLYRLDPLLSSAHRDLCSSQSVGGWRTALLVRCVCRLSMWTPRALQPLPSPAGTTKQVFSSPRAQVNKCTHLTRALSPLSSVTQAKQESPLRKQVPQMIAHCASPPSPPSPRHSTHEPCDVTL